MVTKINNNQYQDNDKNNKNDDIFIKERINTKPGQYKFGPELLERIKGGGFYDSQTRRFYNDITPIFYE